MAESERRIAHFDFVSRVRAAHADKVTILTTQVGCDLSFAFTAVLTAYQHVHEPKAFTPIASDMASNSDENVIWRAAIGLNDDICKVLQAVHQLAFGFVLLSELIRG